MKFLFDNGPQVDPLGPDNMLALVNGPLTGSEATMSGRLAFVTKSPLTGTIVDSHMGGWSAARLRWAGFDALRHIDLLMPARRLYRGWLPSCRLADVEAEVLGLTRPAGEIEGAEILSLGNALELIKDLGDATVVSEQYGLGVFQGTHAIGHTRMATESDVDIRSAHPYWAFPYNDVAIVHNGQITNYWTMRRVMERRGHRFLSDCDSELLAVYTADNLAGGVSLEESMRRSIGEIDGVFTYLVATRDQLGMAKDSMAAKPMVLYESEDLIALASEEVSIRAILPQEIDTTDPYDAEVRVWQV